MTTAVAAAAEKQHLHERRRKEEVSNRPRQQLALPSFGLFRCFLTPPGLFLRLCALAIVRHTPVGPLDCNCVIIADPQTKEALLVDPGGDHEVRSRASERTHKWQLAQQDSRLTCQPYGSLDRCIVLASCSVCRKFSRWCRRWA